MKRILSLALVTCACLYAQDGVAVNQVDRSPKEAVQKLYTYSGSLVTSICRALSTQLRASTLSISAASNAAAVSLTSAAHGLNANSKPQVTCAGGTGNWTAVNDTFTATITGVNTWTMPVDSSTFGALTGTVTCITRAPRTSQSVWSVEVFVWDGTNLAGTFAVGGNNEMSKPCATPTQYQ